MPKYKKKTKCYRVNVSVNIKKGKPKKKKTTKKKKSSGGMIDTVIKKL